jgi:hypothetical protein
VDILALIVEAALPAAISRFAGDMPAAIAPAISRQIEQAREIERIASKACLSRHHD